MAKRKKKTTFGSENESSSSKVSSSGLLRGEGRDNVKRRLSFDERVTVTPIQAENKVNRVSKKKDAKPATTMSEKEADSILANFSDPPSIANKECQW